MSSSRKSSLTTRNHNAQNNQELSSRAARQARRLNRQQKRLEQEMGLNEHSKLVAAKGREVRLDDIKVLEPLTETQRHFFQTYESEQAQGYVLFGSPGVGKSVLALYQGILDVLDPDTPYHKMIIARSSVSTREIGYMPGNSMEKMEVYEAPYHGIFAELTGRKDAYEKLKDSGKVEFVSSSYLRGITFNDSIVVIEEAASMNWHEIKSIVTRVGKNTKLIITGDLAQTDLIYKKNDVTGFREMIEVTRKMHEFRHFKFTPDDIVRSGMVKNFIIACEELGLN